MAFKLIEIATVDDRVLAVTSVAEEMGVTDIQVGPALEDGRRRVTLIAGEIDRQALLDRLQGALGKSDGWRITMLPTDTTIPAPKPADPSPTDEEEKRAARERASREELHSLVAGGARTNSNFFILVVLSTIVASVGLETDNVTVLIGAMLIAPLLGPNVAFAFGAAIGDRSLMLSAMRTNLMGVALSVVIAAGLTLLIEPNILSRELLALTSLDYSGLVLALVSGVAAALSVTTGLSSTLVGVMVAVALLPPAATFGIMLAAGRYDLAVGALMLLAANVACVNLAALAVFVAKGIKPRTWVEQQNAQLAVALNAATWIVLILILLVVITLRQSARFV